MEVFIHSYLNAFPTIILVVIVSAMLYILSKGADLLVDRAVKLSLRWGAPKMIIGATIVSLGTTLPEATVSVAAAVNGNPDLALGNAIGSIITNTSLIIGLAALIGSMPVDRIVVEGQGKVQIWVGVLLMVVSLPYNATGNISREIGGLFILLLMIYIWMSIKWCKDSISSKASIGIKTKGPIEGSGFSEAVLVKEKSHLVIEIVELFVGVMLVIGASKILIPAVEISAVRVGISQSVIAATLVALGTSLPELVTAITAVKKGHGELAIGNIVGANILNVLFVVGSAAAITSGGLDVPVDFYRLQTPTMMIILIAFRLFSKGRNQEINKKHGLFLLLLYLIYMILNFTWL